MIYISDLKYKSWNSCFDWQYSQIYWAPAIVLLCLPIFKLRFFFSFINVILHHLCFPNLVLIAFLDIFLISWPIFNKSSIIMDFISQYFSCLHLFFHLHWPHLDSGYHQIWSCITAFIYFSSLHDTFNSQPFFGGSFSCQNILNYLWGFQNKQHQ